MHCILCGTHLTSENQAGLVCQNCKLVQQGKRRNGREQAVRVRYCACCGKPFHPTDHAIQHEACATLLFALAFDFRQRTPPDLARSQAEQGGSHA